MHLQRLGQTLGTSPAGLDWTLESGTKPLCCKKISRSRPGKAVAAALTMHLVIQRIVDQVLEEVKNMAITQSTAGVNSMAFFVLGNQDSGVQPISFDIADRLLRITINEKGLARANYF